MPSHTYSPQLPKTPEDRQAELTSLREKLYASSLEMEIFGVDHGMGPDVNGLRHRFDTLFKDYMQTLSAVLSEESQPDDNNDDHSRC